MNRLFRGEENVLPSVGKLRSQPAAQCIKSELTLLKKQKESGSFPNRIDEKSISNGIYQSRSVQYRY